MQSAIRKRRRLLLRIAEAAADLSYSPNGIRALIKRGDLEGYRLDNGISHVSVASVRALLKARRADQTRPPESLSLGAADQ